MGNMSRADYDEMAALLVQAGYRVRAKCYDEHAFGSWYVVIKKGGASFRIVWDGKDQWLLVQKASRSLSPFMRRWTNQWIGRRGEDQCPSRALRELQSALA